MVPCWAFMCPLQGKNEATQRCSKQVLTTRKQRRKSSELKNLNLQFAGAVHLMKLTEETFNHRV